MPPRDQYSPPRQVDNTEETERFEESEESEGLIEITNEDYEIDIDESTVKLAFPGSFLRYNYILMGAEYKFTPQFLGIENILYEVLRKNESLTFLANQHNITEPIEDFEDINIDTVLVRNGQIVTLLYTWRGGEIFHYLDFIKQIFGTMTMLPSTPKFNLLKEPANFKVPENFTYFNIYELINVRILHNISKPSSLVKITRENKENGQYLIYYYQLEFRSFKNLIYLFYGLNPLSPRLVYNDRDLRDFAAYFSEIPATQEAIYKTFQEEAKLDPYL